MRIYIIGNDGITLCGEPPATVKEGEIVVDRARNCTQPRLAASGSWHYGILCLVSRNAGRSATATP